MAGRKTSGRHAADEEARAEVDVLNSRLEKAGQLHKKIQARVDGLDTTGKALLDVCGPLNRETRELQIMINSQSRNTDVLLATVALTRLSQTLMAASQPLKSFGNRQTPRMMKSRSSDRALTRPACPIISTRYRD